MADREEPRRAGRGAVADAVLQVGHRPRGMRRRPHVPCTGRAGLRRRSCRSRTGGPSATGRAAWRRSSRGAPAARCSWPPMPSRKRQGLVAEVHLEQPGVGLARAGDDRLGAPELVAEPAVVGPRRAKPWSPARGDVRMLLRREARDGSRHPRTARPRTGRSAPPSGSSGSSGRGRRSRTAPRAPRGCTARWPEREQGGGAWPGAG